MPAHPMSARAWTMLAALSLVWGGSFFFNGVALRELPPLTVVACRVALAAPVLWLALPVLGVAPPKSRRAWAACLGMGLLNNALPFALIAWAQSHLPSGVAAILNATTPLFAVVLAHRFADETLTALRLAGVLAGLAGVAAMLGGGGLAEADLLPQLACLGGAFAYACAGIYGRRFRTFGLAPEAVAAGQLTMAALVLAPLAAVVDRPWDLPLPHAETFAALGGIAVLSSAFAYVLYFRLLALAGPTNLLLVTFLIPATAIGLGVGVLGETLLVRHLAGMALIGLGLACVDGRPVRAAARAVKG